MFLCIYRNIIITRTKHVYIYIKKKKKVVKESMTWVLYKYCVSNENIEIKKLR